MTNCTVVQNYNSSQPHKTMNIQAIGTNVLVKLNAPKLQRDSGIALPEQYSKSESEGEVISFGKGVTDLHTGEVVGFPSHVGTLFTRNGAEYLFVEAYKLLYVRA